MTHRAASCFVNKMLLEHSHAYLLELFSIAAFMLQMAKSSSYERL